MLCALTILAIFGIVLVENLARLDLWIKKIPSFAILPIFSSQT